MSQASKAEKRARAARGRAARKVELRQRRETRREQERRDRIADRVERQMKKARASYAHKTDRFADSSRIFNPLRVLKSTPGKIVKGRFVANSRKGTKYKKARLKEMIKESARGAKNPKGKARIHSVHKNKNGTLSVVVTKKK
jgi:hypothetical protein